MIRKIGAAPATRSERESDGDVLLADRAGFIPDPLDVHHGPVAFLDEVIPFAVPHRTGRLDPFDGRRLAE
jgi:hypothetical protein